jgi:uncharacterized protein with beta-barrel porin domain
MHFLGQSLENLWPGGLAIAEQAQFRFPFRPKLGMPYDNWSGSTMTAMFQQLPGSSFAVTGAAPTRDSLLVSAGAQISFRNGISLSGLFDSDLAEGWRTYSGFAQLRYAW